MQGPLKCIHKCHYTFKENSNTASLRTRFETSYKLFLVFLQNWSVKTNRWDGYKSRHSELVYGYDGMWLHRSRNSIHIMMVNDRLFIDHFYHIMLLCVHTQALTRILLMVVGAHWYPRHHFYPSKIASLFISFLDITFGRHSLRTLLQLGSTWIKWWISAQNTNQKDSTTSMDEVRTESDPTLQCTSWVENNENIKSRNYCIYLQKGQKGRYSS